MTIGARRFTRSVAAVLVAAAALWLGSLPAGAVTVERIVSRSGIEAWLVRESAVPVVAVNFAFRGGSSQDSDDKAGLANMVSGLLDEGAGELDSKAFQQRLEGRAIELSFRPGRDYFHGSLRTLADHRDEAFELLRLALTAPRFDQAAVERVRAQILSNLLRATTNPGEIASRQWWAAAFPDHPYGRHVDGTLQTVPQITTADLRDYVRRVFAREHLKIAIVGDIDRDQASAMLDRVFGGLPERAELRLVPPAEPRGLGRRIVVDVDVPQAVVEFGGQGIARKDPDFIPAYVVMHILGGGSFSSRLYSEIREKRGLAYGVYGALVWLHGTALVVGNTATRADKTAEALEIVEREIRRMAEHGPTADELEKAKSYLKGSYALNLDTSTKIARHLVQLQIDELGIDYLTRRNALIEAVTLEDARRAAKRLLDGGLLVTVAGRPRGLASSEVKPNEPAVQAR
jgi:zinc protease